LIKYVKNIIGFLLLSIGILAVLFYWQTTKWADVTLKNDQTESNLFVIPESTNFDFCVLGASNARVLSRSGNHQRVEQLLGKSMINLAQGKGHGGVVKNKIFLSYFFEKGNTTNHVFYFLTASTLLTNNYDDKLLKHEPFQLDFAMHALKNGMSINHVLGYAQSKLLGNWFEKDKRNIETRKLFAVNDKARAANINNMLRYIKENPSELKDKMEQLVEIIELANKNNSKMTIVFPPSLMGAVPHVEEVRAELTKLQDSYNFNLVDYSQAILNPELYYDHAHLNTAGVLHYANQYLKPLLAE